MSKLHVAGFAAGLALTATAAFAAEPLQVSYAGDASMDCAGIAQENARMDQLIADANAKISGADGAARGAGLANTVAIEGLARSGALARVPGLGMFANNAANLARQQSENTRKQAGDLIQTATTRKALLSGLYAGKSCNATPPAVPAPAGAPAT